MSDNADESSPANEQVPEKTSKIAEKTTKKAEVKPVKSNKKLKEEEKKLSKFQYKQAIDKCPACVEQLDYNCFSI